MDTDLPDILPPALLLLVESFLHALEEKQNEASTDPTMQNRGYHREKS